jgi:hypothetical protein
VAKVPTAATIWYEVNEDMNSPMAEYVHINKYKPNIPVNAQRRSKSLIIKKPQNTSARRIKIIARPNIIMERYFPNTICLFEMGEEYNNLMDPELNSRLKRPIVSNGIYKYRLYKIL